MNRRGFATVIVLWVVGLLAIIIVALQQAAWQQAADGRETLARVKAKWAARAGVEAAITTIAFNTIEPDPNSEMTIYYDLEEVAYGTLEGAAFTVEHEERERLLAGPADAHSKLNVNVIEAEAVEFLPYATEDLADTIQDWIDEDDDTRTLGAEAGYYINQEVSYEPRNDIVRSMFEVELIAGTDPLNVRGEDWNLNGLLDPNENDGSRSWPPDDSDDILDGEWSALLTAKSLDGGYGPSGEPKLSLYGGNASDIADRLQIDLEQAEVLVAFAAPGGADFTELIRTPLNQLQNPDTLQPFNQDVEALDEEQIGVLIDETVIDPFLNISPGKVNINTADEDVFDYLPIDATLADQIILERDGRTEGFLSLIQLLDIPGVDIDQLADLYPHLDVRSNVFVVTSRGRDEATGVEVEMVATIDRTQLPIVIRELRTQ